MGSRFDIEGYLTSRLEGVHKGAGGELNATCPWCHRSGGFYVNITTGAHICFKLGCDQRGRSIINLVAHLEGIPRSEAYQHVMRESVIFARREETPESLVDRLRSLRGLEGEVENLVNIPLPKEYIPVYDGMNWRMPRYLKERNIRRETARIWGMGFCNSGRYGGRVVIPIACPGGQSFTARDTTGEQEPKYLNPTGADHSRLLIGWPHAKVEGDVVLVEGPMDAVKMYQHRIPTLALGGKMLHSSQLAMLFKKPTDAAITVMLDPDQPRAPYEIAKQLTCRFTHVYVAHLPDGVDPGASTCEQASDALSKAEFYNGCRFNELNATIASSRASISRFYP
jgi:hypothetical protein